MERPSYRKELKQHSLFSLEQWCSTFQPHRLDEWYRISLQAGLNPMFQDQACIAKLGPVHPCAASRSLCTPGLGSRALRSLPLILHTMIRPHSPSQPLSSSLCQDWAPGPLLPCILHVAHKTIVSRASHGLTGSPEDQMTWCLQAGS